MISQLRHWSFATVYFTQKRIVSVQAADFAGSATFIGNTVLESVTGAKPDQTASVEFGTGCDHDGQRRHLRRRQQQ